MILRQLKTLIRQCNGGCNIRHPFEDREIQFYVMPWGDTLEMERRLMGGRKIRKRRTEKNALEENNFI